MQWEGDCLGDGSVALRGQVDSVALCVCVLIEVSTGCQGIPLVVFRSCDRSSCPAIAYKTVARFAMARSSAGDS